MQNLLVYDLLQLEIPCDRSVTALCQWWLAIYFHSHGSLIIAGEGRNKKGPRRTAPQRTYTYMADRHFIPRTCSHALWSVDRHDSREKARFYRATRALMKRCRDRCLEVDRFSRSIIQRIAWIHGWIFYTPDGLLISRLAWNEILII